MSLKNAFNHIFRNYSKEELAVPVDLSLCDEREVRHMTSLVNRLAESEIGKQVLESAAKEGYRFQFEPMSMANGYADPEEKVIALNSSSSDSSLVTTLCHECRHAEQMQRCDAKGVHEDRLDVASNLLLFRAMEADAQACAFCASVELSKQGDFSPRMTFALEYGEIASAGRKALRENDKKITHDVLTKTFKGWYDQNMIKTMYEDSYLTEPMDKTLRKLKYKNEEDIFTFDERLSPQEVIGLITTTKNGNYFKDSPNILKTGKFFDVAKSTMEEMEKFSVEYKDLTGKDISKSLKEIPVRIPSKWSLAQQFASPMGPYVGDFKPAKTTIDVSKIISSTKSR